MLRFRWPQCPSIEKEVPIMEVPLPTQQRPPITATLRRECRMHQVLCDGSGARRTTTVIVTTYQQTRHFHASGTLLQSTSISASRRRPPFEATTATTMMMIIPTMIPTMMAISFHFSRMNLHLSSLALLSKACALSAK